MAIADTTKYTYAGVHNFPNPTIAILLYTLLYYYTIKILRQCACIRGYTNHTASVSYRCRLTE